MLEEDRASRRLEVDEQGLPCQASAGDIWSGTTSQAPSRPASASRDTDVGSAATPGLLSESEASELFGDYIDEDSQTVQHVSSGCSSMIKP